MTDFVLTEDEIKAEDEIKTEDSASVKNELLPFLFYGKEQSDMLDRETCTSMISHCHNSLNMDTAVSQLEDKPLFANSFSPKYFETYCVFNQHRTEIHNQPKQYEEESFVCTKCRDKFESSHELFCHMENHSEKVSCQINNISLKKRKCLTLYEKSLVIQELNNGQSVTHLAKKYGVAKSTICNIRQKKDMISIAVGDIYVGPSKRQTLKSSVLPRMEKKLYKWFLNQQSKNCIVSGEILKREAKLIHSQIRENDKQFTASAGWLQKFKKRFGIRFQGEKLSSQPKLVNPY